MLPSMPGEFPFVKVDAKDHPILGSPDDGRRIYRREGRREDMARWFDKVMEVCGHAVSPGGAIAFANVSRAGIYKAINEGRLTAFGFHITTQSRSIMGFKRKMRESAYVYVPVSECKAWGKIIEEKAKAKTLTSEDNPGWVNEETYQKLERDTLEGKQSKKSKGKRK
jgi:hypothetical protein